MQTEPSIFNLFVSLATIATPIVMAVLAGIGWAIKHKIETNKSNEETLGFRIRELEDKLRDDRIETYNALLTPFFIAFVSDEAFKKDPKYKGKNKLELATQQMLTVEYRQVGFKLSLVANDDVVLAYSKLMQFFYHSEKDPRSIDIKTAEWISLIGSLLLEIRKSMGNEASRLNRWDMIEWFMSDAQIMKTLCEHQANQ